MLCSRLLIVLAASLSALPVEGEGKELTLDLMHINDIHSYFEETNKDSARCKKSSGQACYGGVARIYTKQKEIRDMNPDTTIFLNAGDFYQGTLWYSKFKYEPMIKFGNRLNYTAMGIGNHDFDDGADGLVPFAEHTTFDLLASNMVLNGTSFEEEKHFYRSVVKSINGTKVGIIGFITQSTSYNFPNSTIAFTDEISSIQAEATKLNEAGVKILIALGHSGYDIEQEIARNVPLLDVVVGGHSHTFLYTPQDDDDIPEDYVRGPYPTYVETKTSSSAQKKLIPVVQAKSYTKYLGHITLNFDADGELKLPVESAGVSFAKPYLINQDVDQDPETLALMQPYQDQLTEYKTPLGNTSVLMFIPSLGDSEESNLGNSIADSMAAVFNDTTIAIINNGGIRNNIEAGDITGEDIFYVLPFGNLIDKLTLKGKELKKVLEKSASTLDVNDPNVYPGFGIQITGLRLEIRVTKENAGNRLTRIQVADFDGQFNDLVDDASYSVAIGAYLAPAGEQRHLRGLFDDIVYEDYVHGNVSDYTAMADWVAANSPLAPATDGRLKIVYDKESSAVGLVVASSSYCYSLLMAFLMNRMFS